MSDSSGGTRRVARVAATRRAGHSGRTRVAFYVDSYDVGGAEIVLRDLVEALAGSFDIYVIGVDEAVTDVIAGSAPVQRMVVRPIKNRYDFRAMRAHRALFKALRPAVLHVNLHHLGACQWALLLARSVRGMRVVAVEHSLVPPGSREAYALKWCTSRLLHAHVAVGDRSAREIERLLRLRRGRVETIHNGVHHRDAVAHDATAGRLRLGWIGRFDHAKGVDVLLEAVAKIPETTLLLVGDGDERAALQRRVDELAIGSRVVFRLWSDEARTELEHVDVFVLPSRLESFPLTVLEAMIVGLPVIASEVGSVAEAVADGTTGLLVPPADVDELVVALEALLRDPARRAEMGARAREVAQARFGVATMARRYEALYRRLMPGA